MVLYVITTCLCVGEVDYKEIGDCVHVSGYSSTDLCLPALDYLRKCSQVGTLLFTLGVTLKSWPINVALQSNTSNISSYGDSHD